jgi:DNA replication protein DnaC
MNQHPTLEKMTQLRLTGMCNIYKDTIQQNLYKDYSLDEYLALLVQTEFDHRRNRKITNLIKTAGLSQAVSGLNIDYSSNRNLDKNSYERLLSLEFVRQKENLVITGPTGVGKSYLAQSIGHQACQQIMKVQFYNCTKLMEDTKMAKLDGSYLNLLKKLKRKHLLIIDDFGLFEFDNHFRRAFMDIIEDRHNNSSTIITSQIPVNKWHQLIGESTVADAILDRIIHSSHRIELKGDSLRKNKKLKG